MFFIPRSGRFALFALLSNLWIVIGISVSLTYSSAPISASDVSWFEYHQTEARLQRLWYVYTAASYELYKEECGTSLYKDRHVVDCLYFLLSSAGKNRDCLYKDLSDLIVLFTKEDSTTSKGVKFLLKHRYPTFSLGSVFPRVHFGSPKGKYSIYGCLDWMFAPQSFRWKRVTDSDWWKRVTDSDWWKRVTDFKKKSLKEFLKEIKEEHNGWFKFFNVELSDLERSIFWILAEPEVIRCFSTNPSFKKDIGFCMPFYIDVFPGKSKEDRSNYTPGIEAHRFINKVVPSERIDLTHENEALIESMKQHSLFK